MTLDGYFIAPDAYDEPWLWRENGDHPDHPIPVLSQRQLRDDPAVWEFLLAVIKEIAP